MDLDTSSFISSKKLCTEKSFQRENEQENWRFVNLVIYIWLNLVMGSALSLAIPFASKLEELQGISIFKIIFSNTLTVFSTMTGTFVCSYYQEKIGLRNSMLIHSIFQLTAITIFRWTIYDGNYLILAQFFQGLGNSLVMNSRMRFFKNWFDKDSSTFYFPFVQTASFVGLSLGAYFPFLFIDEQNQNPIIFQGQFYRYANARFLISFIGLIFNFFLFKNNAENAPMIKTNYDFEDFKKEFRFLWSQKQFKVYCLCIAIARGNTIVLFSNFNVLFSRFGIPENQASLTLNGVIVMGLLGSLYYSYFLEQKNQPKKYLLAYDFIVIVLLTIIYFFVILKQKFLIKLLFVLAGFVLTNQVSFLQTLTLKNIKTSNVVLLNVIIVLSAEFFIIPANTLVASFFEYENGHKIFYLFFYCFYIYLYYLITEIDNTEKEALLPSEKKDIELK